LGGTAGRREIWVSEKFGIFVGDFNSNKKLFGKKRKSSLLLNYLKILELEF
jgi:hypothetical protein